jgi:hypothetical protein
MSNTLLYEVVLTKKNTCAILFIEEETTIARKPRRLKAIAQVALRKPRRLMRLG